MENTNEVLETIDTAVDVVDTVSDVTAGPKEIAVLVLAGIGLGATIFAVYKLGKFGFKKLKEAKNTKNVAAEEVPVEA